MLVRTNDEIAGAWRGCPCTSGAATCHSSRGAQTGMWSIHLRRRIESETGQCHAVAEVSRGECQSGVVLRGGSKDRRLRGEIDIVGRTE